MMVKLARRGSVPIVLGLAALLPAAGQAQSQAKDPQIAVPRQQSAQPNRAGQVASSSVGEVGQRQTNEQRGPNTQPTARLDTRINNRVQNRIGNRIDRSYYQQADAASSFALAEEKTREPGRRN
ncbi:hypothetical protein LZK98_15305 [Sphingomonas cannabina]|uniref:hypothetical protein n=1 Tax=Sphingomonas cannabina TaxID=2899123 RepID=UPI001F20EB72|nr:hypothetical protein [Sphingomonas cannabina]UIJ44421.1 hypothetical protein LZK98_15305 [Sphingomonas cannabina]